MSKKIHIIHTYNQGAQLLLCSEKMRAYTPFIQDGKELTYPDGVTFEDLCEDCQREYKERKHSKEPNN